jgi:hypothetical protein
MATANPLPLPLPDPSPAFAPVRLEDFSPEAQATIRTYEAERAAGTWKGIPGDEVRSKLRSLEAATEKVAEHFRARGLDPAILWDGTPAEVQAYCTATFGPDDGPDAWLTPTERRSFFVLDDADP